MFYHKLKMFVLVIFPITATMSLTSNLRKAWFILAYSLRRDIPPWWGRHGGRSWGVAGHTRCAVGKQTAMNDVHSSLCVQSWTTPASGMAPLIFNMDLPVSLNLDNSSQKRPEICLPGR